LFQERTLYDLLVEFFVDYYESKPIESYRNEKGEIQFTDTGDELIDRWEEQIANGIIPDLWEAFDEESKAKVQRILEKQANKDNVYSSLSLKNTFDKISAEAIREGLFVKGADNTVYLESRKRQLEEALSNPKFGKREVFYEDE